MQLYDPSKLGAPSGGIFNSKEKKRVTLMAIGALVLIGAVVTLQMQGDKRQAEGLASVQEKSSAELPTELVAPNIDVASLEATAADERPEQRVVLPAEALEAGFKASANIHDGLYAALGGRELNAAIAADLVKEPKANRGKLLRARCFVEEMREMPNPASADKPHFFLRGHLEDGASVYLAVEEIVGLAPVPGEFVRVDGLFLRVHSEEVEGQWREGPLLVGPKMYASFPKIAPVKELDPAVFAYLRDDSVEHGIEGLDPLSHWQLVSFVANLEPNKINWADAPMLDQKTIVSIYEHGDEWRGKPVRLTEARLLNAWTQAQEENPMRVEHMIEGWFTRGDWLRTTPKVARFVAPFDQLPSGVHKEMEVNLRGFFYKNLAYTPRDGGVAIAPFFVVQSIEPFVRPDSPGLRHMAYLVAGSLLVLGIGIVIVLRHDKAKSNALEAELLQRRRERRKFSPAAKT